MTTLPHTMKLTSPFTQSVITIGKKKEAKKTTCIKCNKPTEVNNRYKVQNYQFGPDCYVALANVENLEIMLSSIGRELTAYRAEQLRRNLKRCGFNPRTKRGKEGWLVLLGGKK